MPWLFILGRILGVTPWIVAVHGSHRLATLGRNLAVAGALCAAFKQGTEYLDERSPNATWRPNADGKAAP